MRPEHPFDLVVPAFIVIVFAALGFLGVLSRFDGRVYDLLLRARPPVPEEPSLLILDIDDAAIANVGEWPWSRDVMANGLILMREMGAASAVFDIEYVNREPARPGHAGLTGTAARRLQPGVLPDPVEHAGPRRRSSLGPYSFEGRGQVRL